VGYAGPGRVFFCNSGAEADEALLKLARLHGVRKSGAEGEVLQGRLREGRRSTAGCSAG
jgi:acetylornithine/succinyldiaminopimelate/putrescine aminotransferase